MSLLTAIMCQTVEIGSSATPDGETGLPATDEWGVPVDPEFVWTPVAGCSLQPRQGIPASEATGPSYDSTRDMWLLFAPAGTVIRSTDRVRRGVDPFRPVSDTNPVSDVLEVYGEMMSWPGPDGRPDHIEVALTAYQGGH